MFWSTLVLKQLVLIYKKFYALCIVVDKFLVNIFKSIVFSDFKILEHKLILFWDFSDSIRSAEKFLNTNYIKQFFLFIK